MDQSRVGRNIPVSELHLIFLFVFAKLWLINKIFLTQDKYYTKLLAKIFSSKFYRRLLVKAIRTIHIGITTIHFITTDTIMSLGALLKIMFLTSIKRYKRLFLSRKTSQLYIPLLKKIQLWVWCTIKKYYEKESSQLLYFPLHQDW